MRLQRTKNATRNLTFGIVYRIIAILCPFVVRTVMLYVMGTEYVGLNSLFTSILSFLSLAELGVGTALVYSMYKPIANNDTESICALLKLYRRLYRYIGLIILAIGLVLMFFLPDLVSGDVPADVNLYILFLIYLINDVISYWMFGYKQSLLTAFQRTDIIHKRSMIIQPSMYAVQIVVILLFRNYYVYIIMLPIATLATNLANSFITDRMFPEYKCRGEVPTEQRKEITKKIASLFGTRANTVVLHSADNIVISAFLGLVMVGQYGNYYYILNAVTGIISIVFSSVTAGIGNSLETETIEKNYDIFKKIVFLNAWIVTFCTVALACLYQPFMRIWVHEDNMLPLGVALLLAVYFYITGIRYAVFTYKDAAGIWWEDRIRPYVVMCTNIVLNIISVQIIGIYGVILSTIISMTISIPWETHTVFKYVFHMPSKQYFKRFWVFAGLAGILCVITYLLCWPLPNGILWFVVRAIICLIVPNVLFIVVFHKTDEFHYYRKLIVNMFKRSV